MHRLNLIAFAAVAVRWALEAYCPARLGPGWAFFDSGRETVRRPTSLFLVNRW
jgi:hypothetical protein